MTSPAAVLSGPGPLLMEVPVELRIDRQGQIACVYSEEIDLALLGALSVRRASRVEPDETGWWWADLLPLAGPRLGPFARRSQALAAELTWLGNYLFVAGPEQT